MKMLESEEPLCKDSRGQLQAKCYPTIYSVSENNMKRPWSKFTEKDTGTVENICESRAAGQRAASLGELGPFKQSSPQVYDSTGASGTEALNTLKTFRAKIVASLDIINSYFIFSLL